MSIDLTTLSLGEGTISPTLMDYGAFVGNIEHPVDPSDTQTKRNESGKLDDFLIAVHGAQALNELRTDLAMIKDESLSVFDSKFLAISELVDSAVFTYTGIQLFTKPMLHRRCSSSTQSYIAIVNLSDAHASNFLLTAANAQPLAIGPIAHGIDTLCERRNHLPKPDPFNFIASRNIYSRHILLQVFGCGESNMPGFELIEIS